MERKWTPGPWKIGRPHPTNACLYIQPEGRYGDIATLYGADGDHQATDTDGIWSEQPIRAANAHLIAAAPDLYEALEDLARQMAVYMDDETVRVVASALRKARGEA